MKFPFESSRLWLKNLVSRTKPPQRSLFTLERALLTLEISTELWHSLADLAPESAIWKLSRRISKHDWELRLAPAHAPRASRALAALRSYLYKHGHFQSVSPWEGSQDQSE